jgi:phosphatidate cytidylyltransferase
MTQTERTNTSLSRIPNMSDLGVRAASALVLIPLVVIDIVYGGIWFELFAALLGVMMASEYTLAAHERNELQFCLHACGALCAAFLPSRLGIPTAFLALACIYVLSACISRFQWKEWSFWRVIGAPYVSLPVLALVSFRNGETLGAESLFFLVAVVWAADTGAYFFGRLLGGPKLAPRFSPKKTWAGLFGAVICASIAAVAFGLVERLPSLAPVVVLAGILAIVEQAGDIFESAFKRRHELKDSGNLIPGHGGVLDRIDGLIAAAVVAALIGFVRNPVAIDAGLLVW